MAEASTQEIRMVAALLAPAYSEAHRKEFTVPEDCALTGPEVGVDFILRAGDGTVARFQHTRPAGDVKKERVAPDHARKVEDVIEESLQRHGVSGINVWLTFREPPASKDEILTAGMWLAGFIHEQVRKGQESYFNFDMHEHWEPHLSRLSKWIYAIRIERGNAKGRVGFCTSSEPMAHQLVPCEERFKRAVEKKAVRYGTAGADLALVVDFEPFPISEIFLDSIKQEHQSKKYPFTEIWAVNLYSTSEGCWRMWQRPEEESA
jgi:hypothetical protein